jgi:hypothetical protein
MNPLFALLKARHRRMAVGGVVEQVGGVTGKARLVMPRKMVAVASREVVAETCAYHVMEKALRQGGLQQLKAGGEPLQWEKK